MAHELDTNQRTGRKAMFSVGATPWHGEGIIVAEAPTFDEALVLAGVDYEVQTVPVYIHDGAGMSGYAVSPTGQAVVRTDRNERLQVLATVGDDYVALQNRDAFGVLEPLLDKGVAHLETGGTLRGGEDAWMLVRFDISDPVVQEVFADEVVPFGLIQNNHTGRKKALVMQTPIRVVCANTLGQALVGYEDRGDVVAVAHRGDAKVRMVDAAERVFGQIVERYRIIAEQYRAMKQRILTVEEFTASVLDTAAPLPRDLHGYDTEHLTVRGYDLARANAEARRAAITAAWAGGKGHAGDNSAWEAYNGAVEVIDHDAKLYRTNKSRAASLMGGRLLARKQEVLDHVARLAGVTRN